MMHPLAHRVVTVLLRSTGLTQTPTGRGWTQRVALGIGGLAMLVSVTAQPVVSPAPAPPTVSAFEQFNQDTKHPVSWMTWGADLRIRNEYLNNAITLSEDVPLHEQDYFRFRARVWTTITPLTNVTVFGRLAAEPREWMLPSYAAAYRGQSGLEWRYGIADSLSVTLTNLVQQPLAVTVGRQDFQFGPAQHWWLVADGTPGDGSWTYFFDSARATYSPPELKTRFDAIYLSQDSEPGARIPTIGNSDAYYLTEQNERGVILNASNKSVENTTLDGYFIYKGDTQVRANGDNADIYTIGGRVSGLVADHWQYFVDGAYQFGNKQDPTVVYPVNVGGLDRDLTAFGVNTRLTYLFKDKLNNQPALFFEYLSGDDPDTTDTDEMFDILWGRWPRWSDLYIYSYINETGGKIAQMNNVARLGACWTMNPIPSMTFGLTYTALLAPEEVPTRRVSNSGTLFSYDGNFRGHYLHSGLKQIFNKHLSAALLGEFIWERNYYAQNDLMSFLRAEIYLTW
jgi:hypothetical protein